MGADRRGKDHVVGAGLAELLERAGLLGAGHDHDLGGHLSSGQGYEDGLGVGGHGGDQDLGMPETRFVERDLIGRIARDVQVAEAFDLGEPLGGAAR